MIPFSTRWTQQMTRAWFGDSVQNGYTVTCLAYSFITNYSVFSSDSNRILHPSCLYETAKIPPTPYTGPTTLQVMTVNQAPSVPNRAEFYRRRRSFNDWPKDTGIQVADAVKSGRPALLSGSDLPEGHLTMKTGISPPTFTTDKKIPYFALWRFVARIRLISMWVGTIFWVP